MMNRFLSASLLALLGWAGLANAQVGLGTPVAPTESGSPSLAAPTSCSDCRPRLAHPVLGGLARTMMTPIRAAAGHLMPPAPPEAPTKEEIARMVADGGYSPAEVTAAKIKLDEAQARARRAAVKYLATVDCNYYPEAEAGLIAALRADRSESVRFEAALALGNCHGLTMKIVEALNITVLGFDLDGNPPETSERVRQAARSSLARSLQGTGSPSAPEPPPIQPTAYWMMADPLMLQQTSYAPMSPVAAPNVSKEERDLAQRVSTGPVSVAPAPSPRPFQQFFANVPSLRDLFPVLRGSSAAHASSDARLQGLAPLGSETTLSIPTVRTSSAIAQPSPYIEK